jgi:hypothetical protein
VIPEYEMHDQEDFDNLPKWVVTFVLIDDKEKKLTDEVYGRNPFQAYYNAMMLLQIKTKTKNFIIKSIDPKKEE